LLLRLLRSLHLRLNRRRLILLNRPLRLNTRLVRLVFATTPAAPMSLRLPLAIRLGRPRFWLGYRRFCCHACTSWHFAMGFISSFASALPLLGLLKFKSCFPEFRADATKLGGEASACRQKARNLPGEPVLSNAFNHNICVPTTSNGGCTFPAWRITPFPFIPSTISCRRIPPGMTANSFDATPGPNIQSKRSSLLPDPPVQHAPVILIGATRPAFPG
jgi:hypothetical protein